jgi:transcription initiation factor TFIIE subunit alpha
MRDNGMAKAQLRTYYFLDYSKATDAIKWRMWKVQQTIDVKLRNVRRLFPLFLPPVPTKEAEADRDHEWLPQELDAQGYICPLCKASYTHLDAAALFDPYRNLLACSVCQTEVTNLENEEEVKGNKDRMQRLNRQTKGVVDLLKGLEKAEVPRCVASPPFSLSSFPLIPTALRPSFDVERWLALHGPSLGLTAQLAAEAAGTLPTPQAVVTVQIAGDDDEALEKQKKEEDLIRKREQNALPSWIALSTIKGDGATTAGGAGAKDEERDTYGSSAPAGIGASLSLNDGDAKPLLPAIDEAAGGAGEEAALDAYYASLLASVPPTSASFNDIEGTPFSATSATPALEGTPFDAFSPTPGGGTSATPGLEEIEAMVAAGTGGGKRSREDSSFSTYSAAGETKRGRFDSPSVPPPPSAPFDFSPAVSLPPATATAEAAPVEEDEEDEEWEEDGAGADPSQLIAVNGVMKPFSEVTEEMTGEMSADEYSVRFSFLPLFLAFHRESTTDPSPSLSLPQAYWDVYQQING